MQFLKQSTAADVVLGPFVDDTDGKTTEEALTLAQADLQLTKNGGAAAQKNDATSATHLYGGNYKVPLNTTDTNTLGCLTLMCKESGALPVVAHFMVVTANWYDSMCSTDKLDVNVEEWNATAVPAEHTAGYPIVTVKDGTGTGEIDTASGKVLLADGAHGGSSASLTLGAGATISNAAGAALTLTSSGGNGSGLVATGNGSGHGIIATGGATGDGMKLLGGATSGAGLDVQSQGGTGPTNYAAYFKGNATGADTGGIYAAGGTTGGDGIEAVGTGNGHGLYVVGAGTGEGLHATGGAAANGHGAHFEGVGANSHGLLLTRGGAGGDDLAFGNNDVTVATVTSITNGVTLTDASSDAVIADAVWNAATATYGGSGSYGEKVEALNTGAAVLADASSDAVIADAVWNALTGSYGTANTYGEKVEGLNTGAVTVSSIGNDVITAASLNADAGTEIGTAVWASGTRTLTANTNLNDPSAATIADAVWDELATGHTDAGKAGQQLWTDIDAILADTGTDGVITASLGTQAKTDVKAEVVAALATDTYAEPGSVPAATSTLKDKINWMFMLSRNRVTQTATAQKVYADDGTTEEANTTVSDNGTTYDRGEWTTT